MVAALPHLCTLCLDRSVTLSSCSVHYACLFNMHVGCTSELITVQYLEFGWCYRRVIYNCTYYYFSINTLCIYIYIVQWDKLKSPIYKLLKYNCNPFFPLCLIHYPFLLLVLLCLQCTQKWENKAWINGICENKKILLIHAN